LKARALDNQGYYRQALALLTEIEKGTGGTAIEAMLTSGDIYANRLKDYASARNQFAKVAAINRLYNYAGQAKIRLAEIAIVESKFDEASALLEDLVSGTQKSDEIIEKAMFLQANIALYGYDFKKAEAVFKKTIRQFPSGFYVNDCLDILSMISDAADDTILYFLVDAKRFYNAGKPDSAIISLERARNNKSSKAYEQVLYMLGKYYMLTEAYEKSLAAYQEYSFSYPEGLYADRVLYDLAEIYNEKLSQPNKADELLNKLVTDYPASPLIEKARLYLNKIKSI
jgi:tetratricopeptide (TPR) repeat protein